MRKSISSDFFMQPTETVAQQLLGKTLSFGSIQGKIVETEAYLGLKDPACHSFHGKKTKRTETFYLQGGHIYVYLIYGVHHCLNFITGGEDQPEAVLIRAIEPIQGIEKMIARRKTNQIENLCSGPGKLCQALKIDLSLNGQNLFESKINIGHEKSVPKSKFKTAARVGLGKSNPARDWPLRYFLADNPHVSKI